MIKLFNQLTTQFLYIEVLIVLATMRNFIIVIELEIKINVK